MNEKTCMDLYSALLLKMHYYIKYSIHKALFFALFVITDLLLFVHTLAGSVVITSVYDVFM